MTTKIITLFNVEIDYGNIPIYTNVMDEVKNMMKAVINGQHALKKELLEEIAILQKSLEERFESVDKRLESIDTRLDKQGKQLAFLEDDVPTREEHDNLKKKVEEIEQRLKD